MHAFSSVAGTCGRNIWMRLECMLLNDSADVTLRRSVL